MNPLALTGISLLLLVLAGLGSVGVLFFAQAFGIGASWTLLIIGGLFGTALAMVVEPMLKYHGAALRAMLWRR